MRRILAGVVALFFTATAAFSQPVNQSGTITSGQVPYWITQGVIGSGVTAADSPVTSFGVTTTSSAGNCVNSARQSSGSWISLCAGFVSGVPTISVQNNGSATAQPLQFIINGTTYAFPGSLANITIGGTPVVGGTNSQCLFVSAGVVGQQACQLSAITSLTGDGTATGPGVSALTLATVNANTGTFGSGSAVPIITVNGKGLITSVSTSPLAITVGSTTIGSGATNAILYDNGGVLGNLSTLASAVLVTNGSGVPSLATALPSALTIPSPTFSGTMTMPDAATWTSTGITHASAVSVGSAALPASGRVNVSDQYQVNGSQIAASNLSNGTTGSGSVVLATSPTMVGTWAGSITFSGNLTLSGNDTFSAQLIETGTSAPASAAGNTVVMGSLASAPTLTNTGQGFLFNMTAGGAVIAGDGSSDDIRMYNKSAGLVMNVPTGTTVPQMPGLSAGTCSSGLALDAGNNIVKTSCPGAASAVQVGTTTVTSGTNGSCLYSNTGVLGNHPCITEPQGRITLTANTPVMTATASAQTTLRYDCYNGNQVPYYDGTQDQLDTIASCEVTDAMVSAASAGQVVSGNVYDMWWVHSGANRICLAMSTSSGGGGGWSSDTGGSNTARGTGYSQLDRTTRGYPTNKNAISNCFNGATNYGSVSANQGTYLGTIYASANGQISFTYGASASGGTAALLGVWNMYNRVLISTAVIDNGTSYSYSGSTIRQARASAGNQVQFVTGLAEDGIQSTAGGFFSLPSTIGSFGSMGVGLDSTSSFACPAIFVSNPAAGSLSSSTGLACSISPQIGFHTLSSNEAADGSHGVTFDNFAAITGQAANTISAQLRM